MNQPTVYALSMREKVIYMPLMLHLAPHRGSKVCAKYLVLLGNERRGYTIYSMIGDNERPAQRRNTHLWLLIIPAMLIALIAIAAAVYVFIGSQ